MLPLFKNLTMEIPASDKFEAPTSDELSELTNSIPKLFDWSDGALSTL